MIKLMVSLKPINPCPSGRQAQFRQVMIFVEEHGGGFITWLYPGINIGVAKST